MEERQALLSIELAALNDYGLSPTSVALSFPDSHLLMFFVVVALNNLSITVLHIIWLSIHRLLG